MDTPFGDEITEVVLPRPPLIRVVAQLRFPPVASLANPHFIAPFQEKLRGHYPVLRKEQEVALVVGPNGVAPQPSSGVIWRFLDKPEIWRLSLATGFLALETTGYTEHAQFNERFSAGVNALSDLVHPVIYDRLGLRYINRLQGSDRLARLPKFVRRELLGFIGLDIGKNASISHSLLQTQFEIDGTGLLVRALQLPKDTTFDPGAVPAIPEPSWILDLDAFTTKPQDFSVEAVTELLRRLAFRSYRLFRWSVTDQFITECGGEL